MNRFQVMALTGAAAGMTALSSVGVASAQDAVQWRVEDGGNGHWYRAIPTPGLRWPEARDLCVALGGHLVTMSSAAEDAFARALTPDVTDTGFWIGASRQQGITCSATTAWQWVDGSAWNYTAWAGNQPDCWSSGQMYLVVVRGSYFPGWHDFDDTTTIARAIVEYSADCNSDGIVDYGQIRAGELVDVNANNIPDCCEQGFDCRFNAVEWRVTDGGNGHWYQVVIGTNDITWIESRSLSEQRGGYLATPTSAAENQWLHSRVVAHPAAFSTHGPWLGGYRNEQGWNWVTGEPWAFTAWTPENPSNDGMSMGYWEFSNPSSASWNDAPESNLMISFVVEYSADCNSDGIVDYGQIRAGELVDVNANNIPDCCEQSVSCSPCPGDIDESGAVNSVDLAAVLANWGTEGGKYPRADVNGDGFINSSDLAAVLSEWGPCE